MTAESLPPNEPLLRKFLLGELAGPDLERVANFLARHPEVASTLDALRSNDTLLSDLRGGATGTPELAELAARLAGPAPGGQSGGGDGTLASPVSGIDPRLAPTSGPDQTPGPLDGDARGMLAPPERADEIGRLGRYRVLRILGRGGMGAVFAAEDDRLKRKVALKVMLPALAANPTACRRFIREAETAARVEHDNIVPIYDVGEDRGVPFLAMPLLVGESLDDQLQGRAGPLALADILTIGRQIAEGLAAAHAAGLIHRDIKPSNVWLERTPGGAFRRARILDFGLARPIGETGDHLTHTGTILGTPAYMAPEQARGLPVDHRADLFSLGCVLYQLATGHRPFRGTDTFAILTALAVDNPPPPAEVNPRCPPALSALIVGLLAKSPAERSPETAQGVADELIQLARQPVAQTGTETLIAPAPLPVVHVTGAVTETQGGPSAGVGEATPPQARRRGPGPMWVAAAILLGGLAFAAYRYGGQVIRIITNEGELVVEVDDPHIEVTVKQRGVVISDKVKKRDYVLKAGPGEVVFHDPESGVGAVTKAFEIKRGDKTAVRATLAEVAEARPKPAPKKPSEVRPDLKIDPATAVAPVNLLTLVDTKRDTVEGRWKVVDGELVGGGTTPVDPWTEKIQIPHTPPAEYDLVLVARRTGLAKGAFPDIPSFAITLTGPGCFQVILDWREGEKVSNGLQLLEGKIFLQNSVRTEGDFFGKAGGPIRITCRVREDGVTVLTDGQVRFQWKGDPGKLTHDDVFWKLPDKTRLALAVQNAEYRISEWKLHIVAK